MNKLLWRNHGEIEVMRSFVTDFSHARCVARYRVKGRPDFYTLRRMLYGNTQYFVCLHYAHNADKHPKHISTAWVV